MKALTNKLSLLVVGIVVIQMGCGDDIHIRRSSNQLSQGKPFYRDEDLGFTMYINENGGMGPVQLHLDGPKEMQVVPLDLTQMDSGARSKSWLIFYWPIVSARDVVYVSTALRAVRQSGRNIHLGINAFVDYDEMKHWREGKDSTGSPFWLLVKDGQIVAKNQGLLKADEVSEWIRQHFNQ